MIGDEFSEISTQRVEAFSDGVFAIAITLLILEIKVPHLEHSEASLAHALLNLWTSYFAYIFSFTMIGIYWVNHHYVFRFYKKTDHYFLLLNVFFLMCISFIPFPTALLAEYLTDREHLQTAIVFYGFCFFLSSVSWLLIWLYAKRYGLLDEKLPREFVSKLTKSYLFGSALYLAAVLISLWNGVAGIILCVGLSLFFLRKPPLPILNSEEREK